MGRGTTKGTFTVRASLKDAAAYLFDYDSRANRAYGDIKRLVVERKGNFDLLVRRTIMLESRYGRLQQECNFHSTLKLHLVNSNNIVIFVDPVGHENDGTEDIRSIFSFRISAVGKLKGREKSIVVLRRVGPMETKVEFMTELDFDMPVGNTNIKEQLKRQVHGYTAMSTYFLNILSGETTHEINENDGIMLGELIYEGGREDVKETISNCAILNSLQAEFPWFTAMMEEVLRNKLRPGYSQIETKAEYVSFTAAKKMGKSLAISLATNTTAAGAVDE